MVCPHHLLGSTEASGSIRRRAGAGVGRKTELWKLAETVWRSWKRFGAWFHSCKATWRDSLTRAAFNISTAKSPLTRCAKQSLLEPSSRAGKRPFPPCSRLLSPSTFHLWPPPFCQTQ
nr:uncharacterized protein LOC105100640 isoform X2 [Camelus dromedarius]